MRESVLERGDVTFDPLELLSATVSIGRSVMVDGNGREGRSLGKEG